MARVTIGAIRDALEEIVGSVKYLDAQSESLKEAIDLLEVEADIKAKIALYEYGRAAVIDSASYLVMRLESEGFKVD